MKKLLTLLLILMLTLSMAACGGNDDTPDPDGTGTENNVMEGTEDGEDGEEGEGSGEEDQSNEGGIGTGAVVNPDELIMGEDDYSDMEAEYDFKFDAADSFGLHSMIEIVDYSAMSVLSDTMEARISIADAVFGSRFVGFGEYEEVPEDDIDKLVYAIAMENDDTEGRYLETGAYHSQSTDKHYQYVMTASQNFYEVSSANTKSVVSDLEKAMGITISEKKMHSAIQQAFKQATETQDYFSLKDSVSVEGKGYTETIKVSVDAFATEENVIGFYVSCERERCYNDDYVPYSVPDSLYTTTEIDEDEKAICWSAAKKIVKNNLKAPSTAEFPKAYNSSGVSMTKSGNTYIVAGWVDAENSFGAMLRSNFIVTLEKSSGNGSNAVFIEKSCDIL